MQDADASREPQLYRPNVLALVRLDPLVPKIVLDISRQDIQMLPLIGQVLIRCHLEVDTSDLGSVFACPLFDCLCPPTLIATLSVPIDLRVKASARGKQRRITDMCDILISYSLLRPFAFSMDRVVMLSAG